MVEAVNSLIAKYTEEHDKLADDFSMKDYNPFNHGRKNAIYSIVTELEKIVKTKENEKVCIRCYNGTSNYLDCYLDKEEYTNMTVEEIGNKLDIVCEKHKYKRRGFIQIK